MSLFHSVSVLSAHSSQSHVFVAEMLLVGKAFYTGLPACAFYVGSAF